MPQASARDSGIADGDVGEDEDGAGPDPMQVESVAGPAQCAGVQYKISGVWAVKHVEVVVIWKGRTFGVLGHMLVATTVGEKEI